MRKNEDAYPAFGSFLQANSPGGRARVTRPLDINDLVVPTYVPTRTREEAPAARERPNGGATTTRQLGPGELRSLPDAPRILRPMHIILEPSYMPLAPGDPKPSRPCCRRVSSICGPGAGKPGKSACMLRRRSSCTAWA